MKRQKWISAAIALVLLSSMIPAQAQAQALVLSGEDLADLAPTLLLPHLVDPELPFEIRVVIRNTGSSGEEVRIEIDGPFEFINLPDICTSSQRGTVKCEIDAVPPNPGTDPVLKLTAIAPPYSYDPYTATVILTASNDESPHNNQTTSQFLTFKSWYVTNSLDSGAGSLRAAIEEANGSCSFTTRFEPECKIAFRIPSDDKLWHTIAPLSPLPRITAAIIVDGTTQTKWSGDINPLGPEVELSGMLLEKNDSDGLVFSSPCNVGVEGLTVNGFGGAGIVLTQSQERCDTSLNGFGTGFIRRSYIGTDPTGVESVPNLRGIVVARRSPLTKIEDNLISGNKRSGIFSISGVEEIIGNTIGLNRDISAELPNGASGIYIGPETRGVGIENNFIGFNHHFGVAIDPRAIYVSIESNSIQANWQGGIDRGLDGVPNTALEGPQPPRIDMPIIWGASWRPNSGVTVIEGSLTGDLSASHRVNLYANDEPDPSGYGEGQYVLGAVVAEPGGHFRVELPQDLSGKWVTATATLEDCFVFVKPPDVGTSAIGDSCRSLTSEFSQAVEVR